MNTRLILVAIATFVLSGCAAFTSVGDIECASGEVAYCANQIKAEDKLNGWMDSAGSATCFDAVHVCPFAQCEFSGCGTDPEAGDWVVKQISEEELEELLKERGL